MPNVPNLTKLRNWFW